MSTNVNDNKRESYGESGGDIGEQVIDLSGGGTVPTQITVANEATDATCFVLFVTAATGDLAPKTNTGLAFNASTGVLTLNTPVLTGLPTGSGVSSAPTASTLVSRDANANIFANNHFIGYTATVSAGGTTILTVASTRTQRLTGSSAQTYQLPDATTLQLGSIFEFDNNSSQSLTIVNAGSVSQYVVPAGGAVIVECTSISTANGTWDFHAMTPASVTWGSGVGGLVMNSVLTTSPSIGSGASSSTAPSFIPQRGASTTGFGGDGTDLYATIAGTVRLTISATGITATNLSGTNTGDQTSVSGNAGTVTGATFTTALTVNGGTLTLTANVANTSVLTIGAGAVSVSGSNTGDQTNISGNAATVTTNANLSGHITSVGNTASLGSFTFAQLNTAVSDAEVARTDAANTFTGVQTFSTPIAAGSVATMTATVGGGVPTPPNNTTTFLRGDGTFATPAGGGLTWGTSVAAGSGVALTLTSADLGGGNAFQSSVHTASGTLTACTTTQETISTVRTYTLGSGSVTDNFIGTLFSRSNTNQTAGGTFLVQGSVVKITGTDTQTAGTLTPSYDLLALAPSLRSTGSSLNVTVANSVVTAPTNGHVYMVLGNTQTVAQTLLKLDTGSSALAHHAISVLGRGTGSTSSGVIDINNHSGVTQAVTTSVGLTFDGSGNYNTNSAFDSYFVKAYITENAGAGINTGISIESAYTTATIATNNATKGVALSLYQTGSNGTALGVMGGNNLSASTNGLVNYTLSNTQSGASVIQKTDSGSSSQGHIHHSILMYNASTSARGVKIDPSTTGTGYGIEFSNFGGANFRGISWTNVGNGSAGSQYGIYQGTVSGSSNSGGTTYGIYQGTVSNSASANGYGIYQDIIAGSSAIGGAGWYVANLVDASADKSIGKFFTLNNTQSASFTTSRTANMSEIVSSITNTRTTGTKADNFNNFYVKDTTIQNGAGGTFTVTGAVAKFEVVATQTAGTLTHTKVCLSLIQDNDSTGGHILFNTYTGVPTTDGTLYFDGTNFKYRAGGATKTITAI